MATAATHRIRKPTQTTRAPKVAHRRALETGPRELEQLQRLSPGYNLPDEEVERALESGERRAELEPYFGEAAYEELHGLAQKARRQRGGGPRVLILPGIMGSKLGYKRLPLLHDVIWVDPLDIAAGYMSRLALPGNGKQIKALGVMLFVYLRMKLRLRLAGFDVDFFPFDWRLSIDEVGRELKDRILKECSSAPHKEISLVAHSMGGLVSRSALAQLGGQADCVRRLIMLGTPNHGSFSPVQVLSGMHNTLQKAAALDLSHDLPGLTNIINTFPGLYQMLPTSQKYSTLNLYDHDVWPTKLGIGPRKDILAKVQDIQAGFASGSKDQMTLIAGVNQQTIVDARVDDEGFAFDESLEGDGTVPLKFAELDSIQTYYVNEGHGKLPSNKMVINAVADLLGTGKTDKVRESWTPARRGVTRTLRLDELDYVPFEGRRGAQLSQSDVRHIADAFAAPIEPAIESPAAIIPTSLETARSGQPVVVGRRRQHRLDIRLAFGSITQVDAEAVVLGVYRDVAPAGPAAVIDQLMNGAVREFSERRMLAGNIGEIFIMPVGRKPIQSDMLVFAGMGRFDEINDDVLKLVAENVARTLIHASIDHVATLLLGSASGTDVRSSMANLIEGFFRGVRDTDHHRLRSITICEIDRARYNLMRTELLQLSATPLFDRFEVTLEEVELPAPPEIRAMDRAPRSAGPEPTYLYVRKVSQPLGEKRSAYQTSLLTPGGRATVMSDTQLVDEDALDRQLESIDDLTYDGMQKFGSELAKLMLPADVAKALNSVAEQSPVVVIHDANASKVPWEAMHFLSEGSNGRVSRSRTNSKASAIPALKLGVSRKYEAADLSVAKWLEERRVDEILNMLLIVNPTRDLPGAAREGERIKAMVAKNPHFELDLLEESQATFNAVRTALSSGKYDVVHYAGHAFFEESNRMGSGIVCHGRQIFSGADAAKLERLPALMFFNACESGRVRGESDSKPLKVIKGKKKDRAKDVARNICAHSSFAEAFLRGGVGNFVGTYWPVGDAAADEFAKSFYTDLIAGKSMGEAVLNARQELQSAKLVDWANYIHYGSRSFVLKQKSPA